MNQSLSSLCKKMHKALKLFLLSNYFNFFATEVQCDTGTLSVPFWTAAICYSTACLLPLKWNILDVKNSMYHLKISIYSITDTNIVVLFDSVEIIFGGIINIISFSINKLPCWKEHERFISLEIVMSLILQSHNFLPYNCLWK